MNGRINGRTNGRKVDGFIRRYSIPMIYVKGSYYEVGYDIGQTFSSFIQSNVDSLKTLNNVHIPLYKTAKGKQIYDRSLEAVQNCYPQYVRELEGMADGSGVPFYKLFLLQMDDILPNVYNRSNSNEGQGCSTLILNKFDQKIIGHNEDGLQDYLGHVFIAKVSITEVEPNEEFTAFCYAGLIPGYAMGYNPYLAFTVNVISSKYLANDKIPRTFVTRALLAADSLQSVEHTLRSRGGGVADAMAINLAMLHNGEDDQLFNIEVSPVYPPTNESAYASLEVKHGESYFHCNKFLQLNVPEREDGLIMISSDIRHATKDSLPEPNTKEDAVNILGDNSQKQYNIFRNEIDELVATLAVGIFDLTDRTWSIYTDNPKTTDPVAVLPLYHTP